MKVATKVAMKFAMVLALVPGFHLFAAPAWEQHPGYRSAPITDRKSVV